MLLKTKSGQEEYWEANTKVNLNVMHSLDKPSLTSVYPILKREKPFSFFHCLFFAVLLSTYMHTDRLCDAAAVDVETGEVDGNEDEDTDNNDNSNDNARAGRC